jgi:hypothetical protein
VCWVRMTYISSLYLFITRAHAGITTQVFNRCFELDGKVFFVIILKISPIVKSVTVPYRTAVLILSRSIQNRTRTCGPALVARWLFRCFSRC